MSSDPYNLQRFVHAQNERGDGETYTTALMEMRSGGKKNHWMWYVFPTYYKSQSSRTSKKYAMRSLAEVRAYLQHPVLGPRLAEITAVVYTQLIVRDGNTAHLMNQYLQYGEIRTYQRNELVDVRKLLKCMVLFGHEAQKISSTDYPWAEAFVGQTVAISRHILHQGFASDRGVLAQIKEWEGS